ncbi:hypothetical protein ANG6_0752 [Streptococcus anginosus T5]|uniref:Endonuclease GajA/Old nuclease/RecF-like AAA domain-containing protein n=1 Tax=Streptococcus anginosus T5 TaxID=1163302 RepID=A0AAN4P8C1_STRAP|nr:AAA family ATPase [Streptococcus anginosus]GAD46257.1 hypothetical protein ANG6_0752 [Streptococcus anginosus T5]
MRIDKINVSGYRRFNDSTINLEHGNFAILAGANNSGKTSLIQLLDFVFNNSLRRSLSFNDLPARRELMKKFNHFDISTSFSTVNQYFNASEKAIDVDDFVNKVIKHSYQIFLIDKNGDRKNYMPSEGEKAILSISAILENNQ